MRVEKEVLLKISDEFDDAEIEKLYTDEEFTDGLIWLIKAVLTEKGIVTVEPVKHGKWIEQPLKKYPEHYIPVCSVCEWKAFGKYNFCPHCGAKMNLEDNQK